MRSTSSPRAWLPTALALLLVTGDARGQAVDPGPNLEARDDGRLFQGTPGPATPVRLAPTGSPEILGDTADAAEGAPRAGAAFEEPIDPNSYVCGRGDVLEVNFWGPQNLRQRLTVDSEGRVFLPRIGYLALAGRTLAAARAEIRRVTHRYYPGLSVDLSLAAPRTFLVHVVGNVERPGLYAASPLVRVAALVDRAGVNASRRSIQVVRRGGETVSADLVRYALEGDVGLNPLVQDGDVIRVPIAQVVVAIDGAVRRPGRYELIASKDLTELMALAGGLTTDASRKLPIRIVRRDGKERNQVIRVPAPAAAQPFAEMPLRDTDEVHVDSAAHLQPTVLVVGAVARSAPAAATVGAAGTEEPTGLARIPCSAGDTIRSVLEAAGGVLPNADLAAAYLDRQNDGKVEHVPLDLEALLVRRDDHADRPVLVGDVIVVPAKRRAVLVSGSVARPGAVPFNPHFALDQYLNAGGGLTRDARSIGDVTLLRPDGQSLRYASNLRVLPGDTIVVPQRRLSRAEAVQITLGVLGVAISIATAVLVVTR